MIEKLEVSYVPLLPLEGHCPRVFVYGDPEKKYIVQFFDLSEDKLFLEKIVPGNSNIIGTRQWFTNWEIRLMEDGAVLDRNTFSLEGKTAFIKMDAYALGDNLAWIPYVEKFRQVNKCQVICSTFFNKLLAPTYPNILFIEPNINVDNVYAQYFIGAGKNGFNEKYSPSETKEMALQKTATDILGLEFEEIRPKVFQPTWRPSIEGKYVTLSEFASSDHKMWTGDWQKVVDFLSAEGYKIVVISKEPTNLTGVIDKTGDIKYIDRINDLQHAEFHLGVSSALSWLSWAVHTHVFLISDFTPPTHEFQEGCTRLYNKEYEKSKVLDFRPRHQISTDSVIESIKNHLKVSQFVSPGITTRE